MSDNIKENPFATPVRVDTAACHTSVFPYALRDFNGVWVVGAHTQSAAEWLANLINSYGPVWTCPGCKRTFHSTDDGTPHSEACGSAVCFACIDKGKGKCPECGDEFEAFIPWGRYEFRQPDPRDFTGAIEGEDIERFASMNSEHNLYEIHNLREGDVLEYSTGQLVCVRDPFTKSVDPRRWLVDLGGDQAIVDHEDLPKTHFGDGEKLIEGEWINTTRINMLQMGDYIHAGDESITRLPDHLPTCPYRNRQNCNCSPEHLGFTLPKPTAIVAPPWFDYTNQAWVINGVYAPCAHPASMDCQCFGLLNENRVPDRNIIEQYANAQSGQMRAEQVMEVGFKWAMDTITHEPDCSRDCEVMPDGKSACATPINDL